MPSNESVLILVYEKIVALNYVCRWHNRDGIISVFTPELSLQHRDGIISALFIIIIVVLILFSLGIIVMDSRRNKIRLSCKNKKKTMNYFSFWFPLYMLPFMRKSIQFTRNLYSGLQRLRKY